MVLLAGGRVVAAGTAPRCSPRSTWRALRGPRPRRPRTGDAIVIVPVRWDRESTIERHERVPNRVERLDPQR